MKQLAILILLSIKSVSAAQFISGTVTDAQTGEALIGVSVSCIQQNKGALTNEYGFFSIEANLPCDLRISYIGYEIRHVRITTATSLPLHIKVQAHSKELNEAVVIATKYAHTNSIQTGAITLSLKQMNNMPVFGGERDVFKALQLMPGVQTSSQANAAMLVRGGSNDQNLILLDEAPVYNPSHMLGFFSVFNTDAIKEVSMQKGGFTANYGGRLSSVTDVRLREGNNIKHNAALSVGMLSSRLLVEGPIIKERMSYIISFRRSYINELFEALGKSLPIYFYDITAKTNFVIDNNDRVYLSVYKGRDVMNTTGSTPKAYDFDLGTNSGNYTTTLRWNHLYPGSKMFHNISLIRTTFDYEVSNRIGNNTMFIGSSIADWMQKSDFTYIHSSRSKIRFGNEVVLHRFSPNKSRISGQFNESIRQINASVIQNAEVAAFASHDWLVTNRLQLNYGMRYSGLLGNSFSFFNPEPRFSIGYNINVQQTIKAGYSHMYQYMHQIGNTSFSSPTDLWYPVTKNILPQQSEQYTLGYEFAIPTWMSKFTAEVYYKNFNRVVEFKEGTITMLNPDIESDLLQGKGFAYGAEVLLQRTEGKWQGHISYSYTKSFRQFDELNQGEIFPTRFDRTHSFNLYSSVDVWKRFTFSALFIASSGNRFTPIIGRYLMPNAGYTDIDALPIYTKRNAVVLDPNFRVDINLIYRCNPAKRFQSEWCVGVYNLFNQLQAYRIRASQLPDGSVKYFQQGLFGFIPHISYSIKF
jgi:hypothetical protein